MKNGMDSRAQSAGGIDQSTSNLHGGIASRVIRLLICIDARPDLRFRFSSVFQGARGVVKREPTIMSLATRNTGLNTPKYALWRNLTLRFVLFISLFHFFPFSAHAINCVADVYDPSVSPYPNIATGSCRALVIGSWRYYVGPDGGYLQSDAAAKQYILDREASKFSCSGGLLV